MKIIILITSIIKILPIFIIGTSNAVIYWAENAGLDAIAQLTPTEKDNKAIVALKAFFTKIRGYGETANIWIKKLGI